MNARTQTFQLTVEGRQVEEAVASVFHTILFYRSLGKFHYNHEGNYTVGSIGFSDVDCDFIDFTYVRTSSDVLDKAVRKEVARFSDNLRNSEMHRSGQISLEFFQKKKNRWPFKSECIPWEVWTLRFQLIKLKNEDERQKLREELGDVLTEKILYIAEVLNRDEYVPKIPNRSDLDLVFDTSYPDIQPYLFRITFNIAGPSSASVGSTVKKLIRDTLAL